MTSWYTGNANDDGEKYRGWLVGHFVAEGDIRTSDAVEVKWGVHPAGQDRPDGWSVGEMRSTAIILVSGRMRTELSDGGTAVLDRPGDYMVWGPGIDHTWRAEEDTVLITVRWPSLPN